jgi:RIO kinase 1
MGRLEELLEEGIIDEVYGQLKSGKEAEVWLVSHRGETVAAKLYKEREFRSFKNDAGYKEGRTVRNSRTQRAMDKGSTFGKAASEEAWKSAEADAMYALHAAGVRVPKPVLYYEGVLLMEVIGDAEGRVAPRLVEAQVTREQAEALYLRIRADVVKMLAADLIHGDLSEFNVLLSSTGPVIIDFPQVVAAAKNSSSEQYFRRDLGNMLRFFSSLDPALQRHARDADEIWRAYVRRDLSPGFVPSGRPAPPERQQGRREPGPGGSGRGGPPEQRGGGGRGRPPEQRSGGGRGGPPEQRSGRGPLPDQRGQGGGRGLPPGQRAPHGGRGGGSSDGRGPRPPEGAPPEPRGPEGGRGGAPEQRQHPPRAQQSPRGPTVTFKGEAPRSGGGGVSGQHRRRPRRRF